MANPQKVSFFAPNVTIAAAAVANVAVLWAAAPLQAFSSSLVGMAAAVQPLELLQCPSPCSA